MIPGRQVIDDWQSRWSSIQPKRIDFVSRHKGRAFPVLAINLDGASHEDDVSHSLIDLSYSGIMGMGEVQMPRNWSRIA